MTITMTSKNQITIPKKIANVLGLDKGSVLDIKITGHRIELIPLEMVEKVFTDEEYAKLDELTKKQRKKAKKVTHKFIEKLK